MKKKKKKTKKAIHGKFPLVFLCNDQMAKNNYPRAVTDNDENVGPPERSTEGSSQWGFTCPVTAATLTEKEHVL